MLAKKYRLNRKLINLIYKKGRGKRLGEMGVKFVPNNVGFARYSVIIPKAVIKKVTERNRLRRVIFDELAKAQPGKSADIIIRIFRVAGEEALRRSVQEILRSIDV